MKNLLTIILIVSLLFITCVSIVTSCEKKSDCIECYNDSISASLDFINKDSLSFTISIKKEDDAKRNVKAYVSVYDDKDASFCLLKTYYKSDWQDGLLKSAEMKAVNSGARHVFIEGEFIKLEIETYCYDACGTVNISKEIKYLPVETL